MARQDLPGGTVTLLITDVEGSTRLLQDIGDAAWAEALAAQRRVLREAIARRGGIEIDTAGDGLFAAFPTAPAGAIAARDAQAALADGTVQVRMGLHTGLPLRSAEGYVGVDVHRTARIAAAGHGGQVLVSAATAALATGADEPLELIDLGEHRLKDLVTPERIYQLGGGTFPPIRTLSPSNLPEPAGAFVGRTEELHEIVERLTDPSARVITLVGPGGIGKTRLAIEAAVAATDTFPDGRWWVPLAAVRDPAEAMARIGETLGLPQPAEPAAFSRHLEDRRVLLVLDNVEHLLPGLADRLAHAVPIRGPSRLLVTGREPLGFETERLVRVPVLHELDAMRLLADRAAAFGVEVAPSDALATLVRRLDRLPLALQLAAGRLAALSVEQVVERLGQRLDLFVGARDADPRQRTLRATIEWSHDLLSDDERRLFRRLAVFAGGWTLEAAEAVADATLDLHQGLLDRSLIARLDGGAEPRFEMLESIGSFATEKLTEAGEGLALRARHAAWFLDLAERVSEHVRAGEPEERWIVLLQPELDNLRAAVAHARAGNDAGLLRRLAVALSMFWIMHGQVAEGRAWIEQALEADPAEDDIRRRLYGGLAVLAWLQQDYTAATEAGDAAARLAVKLGPAVGRYAALRDQASAALMRDDYEAAEPLYEATLAAAREDDNGVGMSACRINLAWIANRKGQHGQARALLAENLPFVRGRGQARCEASTLVGLAETYGYLGEPAIAVEHALAAAEVAPRAADATLLLEDLRWYSVAAARLGDAWHVARILGACERAEEELDAPLEPNELIAREQLAAALAAALTEAGLAEERAIGRTMPLAAAVELLRAPSGDTVSPARSGGV